MKRAVLILVAALIVLLVYPSTHPFAKSSDLWGTSGPSVITPKSNGDPIAYSGDNDDDSDDGDSDDVAGWGRPRCRAGSQRECQRDAAADGNRSCVQDVVEFYDLDSVER